MPTLTSDERELLRMEVSRRVRARTRTDNHVDPARDVQATRTEKAPFRGYVLEFTCHGVSVLSEDGEPLGTFSAASRARKRVRELRALHRLEGCT